MKNDKFCVSKSLAYLVALVVAVVAGFYVMNYANTSKVTTNTEAAGGKCYGISNQTGKKVSGIWRKTNLGCPAGFQQVANPDPKPAEGYMCCIDQIKNFGAGGETQQTCNAKKGKIAQKFGPNECTIYSGGFDAKGGRCKVRHSGDGIECGASVGATAMDRKQVLKDLCKQLKDQVVPGTRYVAENGKRITCTVYTGDARGGTGNLPVGRTLEYFCSRTNKSDEPVTNNQTGRTEMRTNNCNPD